MGPVDAGYLGQADATGPRGTRHLELHWNAALPRHPRLPAAAGGEGHLLGVRDLRQLSDEQSQTLNEAPDDLTFALVLLASLFVTFILGAALTYLGISYLGTAGTP